MTIDKITHYLGSQLTSFICGLNREQLEIMKADILEDMKLKHTEDIKFKRNIELKLLNYMLGD